MDARCYLIPADGVALDPSPPRARLAAFLWALSGLRRVLDLETVDDVLAISAAGLAGDLLAVAGRLRLRTGLEYTPENDRPQIQALRAVLPVRDAA